MPARGIHKRQTKANLKLRHTVEQQLASEPGVDAAAMRVQPSSVSASVKEHIQAALDQRFGRGADHIMVETSGDHVTLRGTVASLAEREAAERAAWTTPGVCHVNNNLSVQAGMRPGAARSGWMK